MPLGIEMTETVRTDVLIIGAGAAGLRAAIAAAAKGVEVLVVAKGAEDAPTCTTVAWGGITYAEERHCDELFRQVVHVGGFLNRQPLVEVFAAHTPGRMAELAGFGVNGAVLRNADREHVLGLTRFPGADREAGYALTRPLRQRAEALGVRFLDRTAVVTLLVRDGRVTAAAALDLDRGNRVLPVSASAVVLASGGGAGMFGCTDNPRGTTGDGIALAYNAGAELVDLECVSLQYPAARLQALLASGGDPAQAFLDTGTAHYFLGGVAIGPDTRTTVEGLYAAGECAGGVFGAARLGGAALAEAIVFGAVAGENAAELARIRRAPSAPDTGALMNDTQACLGRGPVRVAETRERLGRILWECAGPVKTEASLMEAEERLGELSARTRTADAADGTGAALHEQVELEAMLTLAPLLCRASRMRRETRGCFWRADHPQPDHDGWLRNIVVRRGADGPEWEVRPVTVTRSMPPSEPPIGAGCFGYLPNL